MLLICEMYIYIPTTLFNAQVLDFVRDGLNDTMPDFGEDTNRGQSVTEAWDYVQENVSSRNVVYSIVLWNL